jgi:phosphoglycolate phosphatase-like HAD superfamily hydrolase
MTSPPPSKPLPDYSFEALRRLGITDQEELEAVARSFRDLQSARDAQNDIIRQYRTQGYAYFVLPENSKRYPPPAAVN